MGLLSKIFGKVDPALEDARRIYSVLMRQARQAAFYGQSKAPDNYDGRIDILTLHIAAVLEALSAHGKQGELLSQAIFDVMRDDFEVAMREEGLSDTGIKRRIKPMMQLFFTRVKTYVEALKSDNAPEALNEAFKAGLLKDREIGFSDSLSSYLIEINKNMKNSTLGEIALTSFDMPALPR